MQRCCDYCIRGGNCVCRAFSRVCAFHSRAGVKKSRIYVEDGMELGRVRYRLTISTSMCYIAIYSSKILLGSFGLCVYLPSARACAVELTV